MSCHSELCPGKALLGTARKPMSHEAFHEVSQNSSVSSVSSFIAIFFFRCSVCSPHVV